MNILLVKTWSLNIGNEIIEHGAEALIKRATPEANIYEISSYQYHAGYSEYFYKMLNLLKLKLGKSVDLSSEWYSRFWNPVSSIDPTSIDIAILPGCVLDKFSLPRILPLLRELRRKNIPLVLLGVGGNSYSKSVKEYVTRELSKIKPVAIITRDSEAYDLYSSQSYFKYTYNGIDCGFFIGEWYQPPIANKDFIVFVFDKLLPIVNSVERNINRRDAEIVRGTHRPFNYVYLTVHADMFTRWEIELFRKILHKRGLVGSDPYLLKRDNIFFSDNFKDYLYLFKNAKEVHSDRVHAIVASVSYGTEAWFYFKTPRALLFENAGIDIVDNKVIVNNSKLTKRKYEMVQVLKDILEDLER